MIYLRINEVAREKGLSVGEIARRGGLPEEEVRALMQHPTTPCMLETLDRVSKALGTLAQELITSVLEESDAKRSSELSEAVSVQPHPVERK